MKLLSGGGFGNTFGCVNTSNMFGNTTPQFGCTTPHDAYNEKKWARFYERDPIRAATSGFTKAHYNAYLQKNFNNFDNKLKCRYGSHCKSGSRCKFTHDTDSLHRPSKVQGNKNRYASSYDKRKDFCRKYRDTGACRFGDECRFSHGDDGKGGGERSAKKRKTSTGTEKPQGVCYAHQRGDCDRGDACRYSHDSVKKNNMNEPICGDCGNCQYCQ